MNHIFLFINVFINKQNFDKKHSNRLHKYQGQIQQQHKKEDESIRIHRNNNTMGG